MTWAAVWAFVRRVPGWVWLAFVAVVTGGAYIRERRLRQRAEARAEVIETIGNNALSHTAAVLEAERAAHARELATERQHTDTVTRIREGLAEAGAAVTADEQRTAAAVSAGGPALAEEVRRVLQQRREAQLRAKYGEET